MRECEFKKSGKLLQTVGIEHMEFHDITTDLIVNEYLSTVNSHTGNRQIISSTFLVTIPNYIIDLFLDTDPQNLDLKLNELARGLIDIEDGYPVEMLDCHTVGVA